MYQNIDFLKFLKSKSKSYYLLLTFLSIINTLTNLGILFVINHSITDQSNYLFGKYNWLVFLGLFSMSFSSVMYFQKSMTALTNELVFDLEVSIINKIRLSSYHEFIKMGKESIYGIVNDVSVLAKIPEIVMISINSFLSILCSIVYLFWVSFYGGMVILFLILLVVTIFVQQSKNIVRDLNEARNYQDAYYSSLRDLIDGFKQIKISNRRNENLFRNYILKNRDKVKFLNIRSSKKLIANQLFGVYSWYLLIGIIIFFLPFFFRLNISQIAIFITIVLFIMGPVSALINTIPFYARFSISIRRIKELEVKLKSSNKEEQNIPENAINFESLRFENIKYSFGNMEDNTSDFLVEIDDFSLNKNEIIFITGANGSGKTSFINLLTGLYEPQNGRFFLNDKEINYKTITTFSNNIAVIFSDHYFFNENYDLHDFSEKNSQFLQLKSLLNLSDILKFKTINNNLDLSLSKGQQKRVALLLAILENKPIILLDEWAAEQDKTNRDCFYNKWLSFMKELGKTVIIVSHDFEFSSQADRVIKFNDGKIADNYLNN